MCQYAMPYCALRGNLLRKGHRVIPALLTLISSRCVLTTAQQMPLKSTQTKQLEQENGEGLSPALQLNEHRHQTSRCSGPCQIDKCCMEAHLGATLRERVVFQVGGGGVEIE